MHFDCKHVMRAVAASSLIAVFAFPRGVSAQASEHLVGPADLQKATVDSSQDRQQNVDSLNRFFSSDQARRALQTSHIDPQQVKSAVGTLSDAELAQLASRANKAQTEFAAGTMSDRDLLLILVAIAALILIIVAVR